MNYVSATVYNNLPETIEFNSNKKGELIGRYQLKYGWMKIESSIILDVIAEFELYFHGVKYGSFLVDSHFEAKTIKSPQIAYEAILASIAQLNTELQSFADLLTTADSHQPMTYGDFETENVGIMERLFNK